MPIIIELEVSQKFIERFQNIKMDSQDILRLFDRRGPSDIKDPKGISCHWEYLYTPIKEGSIIESNIGEISGENGGPAINGLNFHFYPDNEYCMRIISVVADKSLYTYEEIQNVQLKLKLKTLL